MNNNLTTESQFSSMSNSEQLLYINFLEEKLNSLEGSGLKSNLLKALKNLHLRQIDECSKNINEAIDIFNKIL